jgi:hypothetical protein
MPKLSGEASKQVAAAEGGGAREPLPEGKYRARLIDVESTKSKAGNPMWVWKFEVEVGPTPDAAGRWLWERTAIQENTMWKIRQVFDAFGAPADTDTDDLIGSTVDLMVGQTVAERGKMQGKIVNEITEFLPASAPATPAAPKAAEGSEIPF